MSRKPDKFIQAQARQIVTQNHQALDFAVEDILAELRVNRIEGDSAFAYAKEELRRQGISEGLRLLQQKINTYASQYED